MIRGWDARIQTHPEAEVLNKLKSTPEFLSQALRWIRNGKRYALRNIFLTPCLWRYVVMTHMRGRRNKEGVRLIYMILALAQDSLYICSTILFTRCASSRSLGLYYS